MSNDKPSKPIVDKHENKQLRGLQLELRLEQLLVNWRDDVLSRGEKWLFSQAAFAKYAGVSRETVRKKQLFLDSILSKFNQERRLSTGQTGLQEACKKNARLETENSELKAEIFALKVQHLRIYEKLLKKTLNLAVLIEDDLPIDFVGRCPICGNEVFGGHLKSEPDAEGG